MKQKMFLSYIGLATLLIISIITIGCSEKLSRSEAARLISADKKFTEITTNPYFGSKKREFVEITGISEPGSDTNVAQATFNWRTKVVEFKRDKDKEEYEQHKAEIEKNIEGTAAFQKFDDGWRLTSLSGRGLEDF